MDSTPESHADASTRTRPRVLIGGMTANRGGKETFIMSLFDALKDDYECWFLADRDIAHADYIRQSGGVIRRITPRGSNPLRYINDLRAIVDEGHFEAIWLNQTILNSIEPLVIGRIKGVPQRIIHSHSSSNMGSALTGALHHLQKPITPLFATQKLACARDAGIWFYGRRPFDVVPNAFDVDPFTFDPDARTRTLGELGLSDSELVVSHVGLLSEIKNQVWSVHILRALRDSGLDADLVLVGEGPKREEIVSAAEALGVMDHTHLLGLRDDVPAVLQAADVSILPSLFEGLPYTALEAQAAGLPTVVSSNVSDEVAITDLVSFMSLESPASAWADRIADQARTHTRTPGFNPLLGTQFDARVGDLILKDRIALSPRGAARKTR